MKNKTNFYDNLRNYILNNATPSRLAQNPLFRQAHCPLSIDDQVISKTLIRRCTQWLCDLRTLKRLPGLSIEDLEIAYSLKKDALDIIVGNQSYWNQKIHYISADFIDCLNAIKDDPDYNKWLKDLSFPICYDTKTSTTLWVVSSIADKEFNKKQHRTTPKQDTPSYELRYVVVSGSNYAEKFFSKETIEKRNNASYDYTSFTSALNQFEYLCRKERDVNYPGSISHSVQKLSHYISRKPAIHAKISSDLLNEQNLFSGYYSEAFQKEKLLSDSNLITRIQHAN